MVVERGADARPLGRVELVVERQGAGIGRCPQAQAQQDRIESTCALRAAGFVQRERSGRRHGRPAGRVPPLGRGEAGVRRRAGGAGGERGHGCVARRRHERAEARHHADLLCLRRPAAVGAEQLRVDQPPGPLRRGRQGRRGLAEVHRLGQREAGHAGEERRWTAVVRGRVVDRPVAVVVLRVAGDVVGPGIDVEGGDAPVRRLVAAIAVLGAEAVMVEIGGPGRGGAEGSRGDEEQGGHESGPQGRRASGRVRHGRFLAPSNGRPAGITHGPRRFFRIDRRARAHPLEPAASLPGPGLSGAATRRPRPPAPPARARAAGRC